MGFGGRHLSLLQWIYINFFFDGKASDFTALIHPNHSAAKDSFDYFYSQLLKIVLTKFEFDWVKIGGELCEIQGTIKGQKKLN